MLGPVLYNLTVSDILDNKHQDVTIRMYADDVSLVARGAGLSEALSAATAALGARAGSGPVVIKWSSVQLPVNSGHSAAHGADLWP